MQIFAEHVLRVAGAQFFSRAGPELIIIQLFARWSGMPVLTYIQPAPFIHHTHIASKALSQIGLDETVNRVTRSQVSTNLRLNRCPIWVPFQVLT